MNHPWHDLSPGEAVQKEFNAVIEIPLRSNVKYELQKSSGVIRMDGVLYSAVFYPANYGFIYTFARFDLILFVNRNGEPDRNLLRKLQNIDKKAGAKFHAELHKMRKAGASHGYPVGVPLPTLMLESGHESLVVTQDYLADVRKPVRRRKLWRTPTSFPSRRSHEQATTATDFAKSHVTRVGTRTVAHGVQ